MVQVGEHRGSLLHELRRAVLRVAPTTVQRPGWLARVPKQLVHKAVEQEFPGKENDDVRREMLIAWENHVVKVSGIHMSVAAVVLCSAGRGKQLCLARWRAWRKPRHRRDACWGHEPDPAGPRQAGTPPRSGYVKSAGSLVLGWIRRQNCCRHRGCCWCEQGRRRHSRGRHYSVHEAARNSCCRHGRCCWRE